jgi:hypothetical protein
MRIDPDNDTSTSLGEWDGRKSLNNFGCTTSARSGGASSAIVQGRGAFLYSNDARSAPCSVYPTSRALPSPLTVRGSALAPPSLRVNLTPSTSSPAPPATSLLVISSYPFHPSCRAHWQRAFPSHHLSEGRCSPRAETHPGRHQALFTRSPGDIFVLVLVYAHICKKTNPNGLIVVGSGQSLVYGLRRFVESFT